jgi:hypothetical protein
MIELEILTDTERPYFGLDPIAPEWERVEIKDGFAVYFDNNVIRKTVYWWKSSNNENYIDYLETDNEIQTRDRLVVLPRTAIATAET